MSIQSSLEQLNHNLNQKFVYDYHQRRSVPCQILLSTNKSTQEIELTSIVQLAFCAGSSKQGKALRASTGSKSVDIWYLKRYCNGNINQQQPTAARQQKLNPINLFEPKRFILLQQSHTLHSHCLLTVVLIWKFSGIFASVHSSQSLCLYLLTDKFTTNLICMLFKFDPF